MIPDVKRNGAARCLRDRCYAALFRLMSGQHSILHTPGRLRLKRSRGYRESLRPSLGRARGYRAVKSRCRCPSPVKRPRMPQAAQRTWSPKISKGATAHSSQCDGYCAIRWQMFSKSLPASRDLFCELETGHRSLSHEGRHRRNWPEIKRGGALSGLGITRVHRTQDRHGGSEITKKIGRKPARQYVVASGHQVLHRFLSGCERRDLAGGEAADRVVEHFGKVLG